MSPRPVERVLLAMDVGTPDRAGLAAVAAAARLGAELLVLFSEDGALLALAAHPMVRHVSTVSGRVEPLQATVLRHELRQRALQAQTEVQRAADEAGVRASFQRNPRSLATALAETLRPGDAIMLQRSNSLAGHAELRSVIETLQITVLVG